MEQLINIAEILEGCPQSTMFSSQAFGSVAFVRIYQDDYEDIIEMTPRDGSTVTTFRIEYDKYGRLRESNLNKVDLLPLDGSSWKTFKPTWKHKNFEPFEKILYWKENDVYQSDTFFADFYSHYDEIREEHVTISGKRLEDDFIIPYKGNEDKLGKEVDDEK